MFPNIPFTLEAVPAPGYAFSHWTGTAGGASVTVSLNGATTISATFIPSGETVVGGTLAGDTTLLRSASPYTLSSDLIVPAGTTLTIEAGVVIHMPARRNLREPLLVPAEQYRRHEHTTCDQQQRRLD